MPLLDWFTNRFRHEAVHYVYAPIPASNVRYSDGKAPDYTELAAGADYFKIWLVEMFLKRDRDWFSRWHPAVHAAVTFQFGGDSKVISSVVSQTRDANVLKDFGDGDLDRFVRMNAELTGLLPFNDGSVAVDVGLIGLQGNSDVKNLIKAMGSFGSLLAVPQLSAAVKVAEPLANAIGSLVGATEGALMIGLSQTFSEKGGGAEAVLRGGYYAMVDASGGQVDRDKLWVVEDHLQYGGTAETSKPLVGYNYILIRVERRDKREDWDDMPAIHGPYQNVLNALQTGNVDQAKVHLKTAIAAAVAAPELTKKVDRRRVVEALNTKFEDDRNLLITAPATRKVDTSLKNLMKAAPPAKQFVHKPIITEKEAFALLK
jgi:hypothetical protein